MCHLFKYVFLLLVATCFVLQTYSKPQLYGSKCYNANEQGNCTPLPECEVAFEKVKNFRTHDYSRCGFDNFTEIVCCPNVKEVEIRGVVQPRLSEKQCKQYSKSLPVVLSYHITGGENAEEKEFPHMAALGFYNSGDKLYRFSCGGTLISHNYVVTAAHCIISVQESELKIVRLGEIEVPEFVTEPNLKIDFLVENVTVHPKYNWKAKLNDLALVKLKKNVVFTDKIRPACLYVRNDDPIKLTVTGWGVTKLSGDRSPILQKAVISAVPLSECNNTYQTKFGRSITEKQICAADDASKSAEILSDACQGDSGGPLQTGGTGSILTIVGVTSYGIGCGTRHPSIYTRISSYLDWMEKIVWP